VARNKFTDVKVARNAKKVGQAWYKDMVWGIGLEYRG